MNVDNGGQTHGDQNESSHDEFMCEPVNYEKPSNLKADSLKKLIC